MDAYHYYARTTDGGDGDDGQRAQQHARGREREGDCQVVAANEAFEHISEMPPPLSFSCCCSCRARARGGAAGVVVGIG